MVLPGETTTVAVTGAGRSARLWSERPDSPGRGEYEGAGS
jgi:hypothetical protein